VEKQNYQKQHQPLNENFCRNNARSFHEAPPNSYPVRYCENMTFFIILWFCKLDLWYPLHEAILIWKKAIAVPKMIHQKILEQKVFYNLIEE
jgi:hypothetical protein